MDSKGLRIIPWEGARAGSGPAAGSGAVSASLHINFYWFVWGPLWPSASPARPPAFACFPNSRTPSEFCLSPFYFTVGGVYMIQRRWSSSHPSSIARRREAWEREREKEKEREREKERAKEKERERERQEQKARHRPDGHREKHKVRRAVRWSPSRDCGVWLPVDPPLSCAAFLPISFRGH